MFSREARNLVGYVKKLSPVAVAFSGGLDSSVVAKAAGLASRSSVAITVDDFTVPRGDLRDARYVAKKSGIKHIVIKSSPPKKVLENPIDRCFYCKSHNYGIVGKVAGKLGIKTILDGANADDTREYRPGMRAAKAMGVRSPLLELGIGKEGTRKLAKEFGLPVWDKPSSACLSSRVPCGERITRVKLGKVERAEIAIRRITGVSKVRVRVHSGLARIEVPSGEIPKLLKKDLMIKVAKKLRSVGFSHVTVDLDGYRPGGN
ncbi:MAG: ATP-dependent sacrificial sulfur transferase LarE [Candidatus Micrarchaeota archaeon]